MESKRARLVGTRLRQPELEAEFRASTVREDGRTAAVLAIAFTLFSLPFIPNEWVWSAPAGHLAGALAVHACFLAACLATAVIGLRVRKPRTLDLAVLGLLGTGALATFLIQATRPPDFYLPVISNVIVVLLAWTVFPNTFELQFLAALSMSVSGAAWIVAFRHRPPPEAVRLLGFVFLVANVAGGFASWKLHRSRRLQFLAIRDDAEGASRLRASEERLAQLLKMSPNAIVVLRGEVIEYVNDAGARLVGLDDPAEIVGHSLFDFVHPDSRARAREALGAAQETGTVGIAEYRLLHRDGSPRTVESAVSRVHDSRGPILQVVFRDITEERALVSRLQLASRLAAVGTLVAGVGHELNNPLTGITAGLGTAMEDAREILDALVRGETPSREALVARQREALEALGDASEGAARIAQIVKDLSAFGGPGQERTRVPMAEVAESALRWLPASVRETATVSVEDRGAPDAIVSRGQLEQVIVNLVSNAARATRPGTRGEILVRTGPGSPGTTRIEVEDHGTGIDPAILGRIFDPFFTTRPAGEGRGTGLGLSICHAVVTAYGGTISVESEVGKGSTFRVELPVAGDAAQRRLRASPAHSCA